MGMKWPFSHRWWEGKALKGGKKIIMSQHGMGKIRFLSAEDMQNMHGQALVILEVKDG
jgi:hypothetical protein